MFLWDGLACIPTFLWDFSGVLVNLRVSPAFLFSGVLISGYVRFFTVDLVLMFLVLY